MVGKSTPSPAAGPAPAVLSCAASGTPPRLCSPEGTLRALREGEEERVSGPPSPPAAAADPSPVPLRGGAWGSGNLWSGLAPAVVSACRPPAGEGPWRHVSFG